MQPPGLIEEDDDFAVERDVFSVAPMELPVSKVRRISKPKAPTELTDSLSPWEYVVVWTLLLILHGVCASYLLAMTMLYFFMENPLMAYYTNLLALPEHRYFRLFGTLVGILGPLHGLQLVLHLLWSIKARSPAVFPRAAMVDRVIKSFSGLKKAKTQPIESRSSRSRTSLSSITSFTAAGLKEVLSVEGSHFELVFVVRKAVEASAQIVQCSHFSALIGRVWINQVYTAMAVANCWVTPLLDYIMLTSKKREVIQASDSHIIREYVPMSIRGRILSVVVDTLLTMMACLILPLTIFVPYARVFDYGWYGFPMEMLYGDVAFPNLIRENQALFALNFVDGVTKIIPHLSILLAMASISLLLELYPPKRMKSKARASVSVATSAAVRGKSTIKSLSTILRRGKPSWRVAGMTFFRRVVTPMAFVAAGALALGLHLHAAYLASTADADTMKMCLQGLRPWFSVNVSCSVLEYNCYNHNVPYPVNDILERLQSDAVTAIVFEHCPEFRMPASIRRFSNMLGLELWNVSIVEWGADTALNADLHPDMIYLIMVYTNMTAMPQGLLTAPLPPLLADIEISITNLTLIPDELADAWSNVRLVYLEHAPLKEFPTALFEIPSLSVSLLDDGLETVPEDLFTTISLLDEYLEVCFSYNPIKSLPSSIREGMLISYLSIDHTNLTELPAWTDSVGQWIELGGSPICNNTEVQLSAITNSFDYGLGPFIAGKYPIWLVEQYRLI